MSALLERYQVTLVHRTEESFLWTRLTLEDPLYRCALILIIIGMDSGEN